MTNKKSFLIIMIMTLVLTSLVIGQTEEEFKVGLMVAWELENTSIQDSVTGGTGTNVGGDFNTSGISGQAMDLELANTDYATYNMDADYTGEYCLSWWSNTESTGVAMMFSTSNGGSQFNGRMNLNSAAAFEYFSNSGDGAMATAYGHSNARWYHYLACNQNSRRIIYVNGTLLNNDSSAGNLFELERNFGRHSAGEYYDGLIDEMYFWNRTLNSTEIAILSDSTHEQAFYPFNIVSAFEITASNVFTSAAITNFTAWVNGTTHTTTNGTIIIGDYNNTDAAILDIEVSSDEGNGYFNNTYFTYSTASDLAATLRPKDSLNITFRYEINDTLATGVNMTFDIVNDNETFTNTTTTATAIVSNLSRGFENEIIYRAEGNITYLERSYFVNITNDTQDVTLYIINENDDPNVENVTAVVQDGSGTQLQGAKIEVLRFYVSCNCFKTVEMGKTNFEGETNLLLSLNSVDYKFQITYQDEIVLLTSKTEVYETLITFTVGINLAELEDFYQTANVLHSLNYTDGNNSFSFYWTDTDGHTTQACLNVTTMTALNTSIFFSSVCESTSTGIIYSNITNTTGTTYVGIGYILLAGEYIAVEAKTTSFTNIVDDFGRVGLFWTFLLIMMITLSGIWDLTVMLVMQGIAIIITRMMGLHALEWSTVTTIMMVIFIIVYMINKRR